MIRFARRITRTFTTWLVFASVLFGSTPHAFAQVRSSSHLMKAIDGLISQPSQSAQSSQIRLVVSNLSSKELRQRLEEAAIMKPKEALVGVGHTLLFIMVLAGIELTAKEIEKNGGAATLTPSRMTAIVASVAKAIVDSPQMWTAIIGAGGLSITQKPAIAIGQVLLHPKLRSTFAPILARVISSTIAFVGWEFGSQLYTEATLLLESKADFELASSAGGLARGVLATARASKAKSASPSDQNSARVAKAMMQNMIRILLWDSQLRSAWISNTMRLHILTGEFSTLLTSMIAAGAIGTMIFPGGGTLVGLIFGLVGGISSMFIPQSAKDRVTYGFQSARSIGLGLWMARNRNRLSGQNDFAGDLKARHSLRSRLITVHWERLLKDFEANKSLATTGAVRMKAMRAVYEKERKFFANLPRVDGSVKSQLRYALLLRRENVRIATMIEFIDAIAAEIQLDPHSSEILKFIEASQSRGFDETEAVVQWLKSV